MNLVNRTISILIVLVLVSSYAFSAQTEEYLILGDIGDFKFITEVIDLITEKPKPIQGYAIANNSGILIATGHFDLDHMDTTFSTAYERDNPDMAVSVQVTQHAGAESDKWLLHEVESRFRDEEEERLGLLTEGTVMRIINSNRVFMIGIGGGSYTWLSDNKVVKISYVDLQGTKPEPLEIVKAYLAKHPSTITLTDTDMKSNAHNEKWLKDEMERRLWLCDKWFMQLQLGKAGQEEVLKEAVEHMEVFLNYREKYYGISGEEEKDLLDTYLGQKSGTEIKNRLEALKQWWTDSKENPINL